MLPCAGAAVVGRATRLARSPFHGVRHETAVARTHRRPFTLFNSAADAGNAYTQGRGSPAGGAEHRLSHRHEHSSEQLADGQWMPRRFHVVRCGLGGQPRLALRQLSVLRLPTAAGPRDRRGRGSWDRHRRLQSRRLLGPLLRGPAVVCAALLLDQSAAASAPTPDASQASFHTRKAAARWPRRIDSPTASPQSVEAAAAAAPDETHAQPAARSAVESRRPGSAPGRPGGSRPTPRPSAKPAPRPSSPQPDNKAGPSN